MGLSAGDKLVPMATHPGSGLRAAGGLWSPPAPALRNTMWRWLRHGSGHLV
ncbi:MAG: hypothetical protein ACK41W_16870 [Cyanobacteriota bacterium]|jgi:hypothetical protein